MKLENNRSQRPRWEWKRRSRRRLVTSGTLVTRKNMTAINLKIILAIFLVLLLTHCTTDPVITSYENVGFYYVRCTLNPDHTVQQLVLCKTVPEDLPLDIPDAEKTRLKEMSPASYIGLAVELTQAQCKK